MANESKPRAAEIIAEIEAAMPEERVSEVTLPAGMVVDALYKLKEQQRHIEVISAELRIARDREDAAIKRLASVSAHLWPGPLLVADGYCLDGIDVIKVKRDNI